MQTDKKAIKQSVEVSFQQLRLNTPLSFKAFAQVATNYETSEVVELLLPHKGGPTRIAVSFVVFPGQESEAKVALFIQSQGTTKVMGQARVSLMEVVRTGHREVELPVEIESFRNTSVKLLLQLLQSGTRGESADLKRRTEGAVSGEGQKAPPDAVGGEGHRLFVADSNPKAKRISDELTEYLKTTNPAREPFQHRSRDHRKNTHGLRDSEVAEFRNNSQQPKVDGPLFFEDRHRLDKPEKEKQSKGTEGGMRGGREVGGDHKRSGAEESKGISVGRKDSSGPSKDQTAFGRKKPSLARQQEGNDVPLKPPGLTGELTKARLQLKAFTDDRYRLGGPPLKLVLDSHFTRSKQENPNSINSSSSMLGTPLDARGRFRGVGKPTERSKDHARFKLTELDKRESGDGQLDKSHKGMSVERQGKQEGGGWDHPMAWDDNQGSSEQEGVFINVEASQLSRKLSEIKALLLGEKEHSYLLQREAENLQQVGKALEMENQGLRVAKDTLEAQLDKTEQVIDGLRKELNRRTLEVQRFEEQQRLRDVEIDREKALFQSQITKLKMMIEGLYESKESLPQRPILPGHFLFDENSPLQSLERGQRGHVGEDIDRLNEVMNVLTSKLDDRNDLINSFMSDSSVLVEEKAQPEGVCNGEQGGSVSDRGSASGPSGGLQVIKDWVNSRKSGVRAEKASRDPGLGRSDWGENRSGERELGGGRKGRDGGVGGSGEEGIKHGSHATEAVESLHKELEQLKAEHARQLADLGRDKDRLSKQLQDEEVLKAEREEGWKEEVEILKYEVQVLEEQLVTLQHELDQEVRLREEAERAVARRAGLDGQLRQEADRLGASNALLKGENESLRLKLGAFSEEKSRQLNSIRALYEEALEEAEGVRQGYVEVEAQLKAVGTQNRELMELVGRQKNTIADYGSRLTARGELKAGWAKERQAVVEAVRVAEDRLRASEGIRLVQEDQVRGLMRKGVVEEWYQRVFGECMVAQLSEERSVEEEKVMGVLRKVRQTVEAQKERAGREEDVGDVMGLDWEALGPFGTSQLWVEAMAVGQSVDSCLSETRRCWRDRESQAVRERDIVERELGKQLELAKESLQLKQSLIEQKTRDAQVQADKVVGLEEVVQQMTHSVQAAMERSVELERDKQVLDEVAEDYSRLNGALTAELEGLKREYQLRVGELEEARRVCGERAVEVEEVRTRLDELHKDFGSRVTEQEALKESFGVTSRALDDARRECDLVKGQLEETKRGCQAKTEELDGGKRALDERAREFVVKVGQLEALKAQYEVQSGELEEVRRESQCKSDQLETLRRDCDALEDQLQSERDDAKTQLTRLTTEVGGLRQLNKELRERHQHSMTTLVALRQKVVAMVERSGRLIGMFCSTTEAVYAKALAMSSRVKRVGHLLGSFRTESARTELRLREDNQTTLADVSRLMAKVGHLEELLLESQGRVDQLQKASAHLDSTASELTESILGKDRLIEELHLTVSEKERQLAEMQAERGSDLQAMARKAEDADAGWRRRVGQMEEQWVVERRALVERVEELQAGLDAGRTEVGLLKQRERQLVEECVSQKEGIAKLEGEVAELVVSQDKLRGCVGEGKVVLENERKLWEEERVLLGGRIGCLGEEVERLESVVGVKGKEVVELRREVEKVIGEGREKGLVVEKLEEQLKRALVGNASGGVLVGQLRQSEDELKKRVAEEVELREGLQLELEECSRRRVQKEEQMRGVVERLEGMEEELEEKRKEVGRLGERVVGLERVVGEKEGELEEKRGEVIRLGERVVVLERVVGEKEGELEEKRGEVIRLGERVVVLERVVGEKEGELEEKRGEVIRLGERVVVLERVVGEKEGELEEKRGEVIRLGERVVVLERVVGEKEGELEEKRGEVIRLGERVVVLERVVGEKEGELEEKRGEVIRLGERVVVLERVVGEKEGELEEKRGEVIRLGERVVVLERVVGEKEGELEEKRGEVIRLGERVVVLERVVGEKEGELEEKRGEVIRLGERVVVLERVVGEKEGELEEKRGEVIRLGERVVVLERVVGEKEGELEEKRGEVIRLGERVVVLERVVGEKEGEVRRATERLEVLEMSSQGNRLLADSLSQSKKELADSQVRLKAAVEKEALLAERLAERESEAILEREALHERHGSMADQLKEELERSVAHSNSQREALVAKDKELCQFRGAVEALQRESKEAELTREELEEEVAILKTNLDNTLLANAGLVKQSEQAVQNEVAWTRVKSGLEEGLKGLAVEVKEKSNELAVLLGKLNEAESHCHRLAEELQTKTTDARDQQEAMQKRAAIEKQAFDEWVQKHKVLSEALALKGEESEHRQLELQSLFKRHESTLQELHLHAHEGEKIKTERDEMRSQWRRAEQECAKATEELAERGRTVAELGSKLTLEREVRESLQQRLEALERECLAGRKLEGNNTRLESLLTSKEEQVRVLLVQLEESREAERKRVEESLEVQRVLQEKEKRLLEIEMSQSNSNEISQIKGKTNEILRKEMKEEIEQLQEELARSKSRKDDERVGGLERELVEAQDRIGVLERSLKLKQGFVEPEQYLKVEGEYVSSVKKIGEALTFINSMKLRKKDQEALLNILTGV
jgi:chromosome segregation ATPase